MEKQKQKQVKKQKPGVNPLIVAGVLAVIVIIGVIYMATNSSAAQVVAVGDNISVQYTGTLTNGTVFDSNVGKSPLTFTVGSGQLIKGFDQGVVGMKVNQSKTITIPANEAYGPENPQLISTVPRSQFGNQVIQVGMGVGTTINGQQVSGVITAVTATNVTVNFNPPLAGQTLIFTIKILSINK